MNMNNNNNTPSLTSNLPNIAFSTSKNNATSLYSPPISISNRSNGTTLTERRVTPNASTYTLTPKSRKRNRTRMSTLHPLSPAALRSVASKTQLVSRGSSIDHDFDSAPPVLGKNTVTLSALRVHRPQSFQSSINQLSDACHEQLTKHTPIAFLGPGGAGKTVLLRAWLKLFQRENEETSVNLVTIGETLEARDYLSVVYALGKSLLLSVAKAAKAITVRLVRDGLAPEGGAKNGPLDIASQLCDELGSYLNGSLTTMHTPSEYLHGWITRTANTVEGLKLWIALDGVDFVQDKDLDGNNTAEARELISAVPSESVGLIVSMRDDYHMLDMWRLEGWKIIKTNPWTEKERDDFLRMRWRETGCQVSEKDRGEASMSLETPQALQVVVQETIRLGSGCIEPIIEHTRSSVALFDYALELWEQDDRFAAGLLPCVLTAILLSPRGASPEEIALTHGWPVSSILELEELAGTFLVFVDGKTIPSLPAKNIQKKNHTTSVLHFPNDDFSKAVALRYLGTDVVAPESQMLYIDTRGDGLFSRQFIGTINLPEVSSTRQNTRGLSMLVANTAIMNASANQFNVLYHTVGQKLAQVALLQVSKVASLLLATSPAQIVVAKLKEISETLFRTKLFDAAVSKMKKRFANTIPIVLESERNDDVVNNDCLASNVDAAVLDVPVSPSPSPSPSPPNDERHTPSLQEISSLLHELLSSESMDMLLKEFTEGGKRRQAEQIKRDEEKIQDTSSGNNSLAADKSGATENIECSGVGGKHRQFSNLQANKANAEFLAHAQDGKAANYSAAMFILRRDPFVKSCQKVLPQESVPDKDLYTLFDALDWTADSDRDGFVSWEDFVDLILISAKGKDLSTNDDPSSSEEKQETKLQDSLVWQLQLPDPVLSFSKLAALPKDRRDLISNILPVYNDFVATTHNGTLTLVSEPTPDQVSAAELKGMIAKRSEVPLPLLENDLNAVTICWCPWSRVVCCSLMRRTAPSFVGLQFLEPLAHWALSDHSVHFDVHATPITALSCYYGALPSDLASSTTTESFEVIFVGCEDGSIRFSELSDMIHSIEDSVLFHPRDSTSLITVIQYIPEIQKIVTCSMDGNVRLIKFSMAGDIVSGLKLEVRGIQGIFNWHSRPVLSIQYCKESHCFLSAGLDTTMYLWQPSNFKILKAINTGYPSKGAHLLEGTSQVVTIDAEIEYRNEKLHQCARVFNLFSGLEEQSIDLIGVRPQAKPVQGSAIVVGNVPGACSAMIFDQRRGHLFIGSHKIRTLERAKIWQPSAEATHEHSICAVLFSSHHMQLTTVDQHGTARVWNVRESTLLFDFKVVPEPNLLSAKKLASVTAACLGYAQERLFTGYSDGRLAAFRIYNGGNLQEYAANEVEPIVAVEHLHETCCVVALSIRGTISFWRDILQIDPLKCIRSIEGMSTGTLNFMSIYGDKTFSEALVGDTHGRMVVWNALSSYAKADRFNWSPGGGPAALNPELSVSVSCGHICQGAFKSFLVTGSDDGYLRMYYLSIHRGLSMIRSVFSGGFAPPRDGSHILGPSAMDISEEGTEIIVGDSSGGVRIWSVTKVKEAKIELDMYPVDLQLCAHWSTFRPHNEDEELPDLLDLAVSSLVAVKGRHTLVIGNRFSVKLYTRSGVVIGAFGQKRPWQINTQKNGNLQSESKPESNTAVILPAVWSLLGSNHGPMPEDWVLNATDRKIMVSPLARKLEMRRQQEESKKEQRLYFERVQSSILTFNALALGEVKAVTLDGRENANLEETQGQAVLGHLAMRSGIKNQQRFLERMQCRRPLPPGTPGAIFGDKYGGQAIFLPATPLSPFRKLEKGLHLKEPES